VKSKHIYFVEKHNKSYTFQAIIFEEASPKGKVESKELHRK